MRKKIEWLVLYKKKATYNRIKKTKITDLTSRCESDIIRYVNNVSEKETLINSAGWSSLEARRAHNPKVIGSNPIPATN